MYFCVFVLLTYQKSPRKLVRVSTYMNTVCEALLPLFLAVVKKCMLKQNHLLGEIFTESVAFLQKFIQIFCDFEYCTNGRWR